MDTNTAIKKRLLEICEKNGVTLTSLCLKSGITPSTLFDFMSGKTKSPTVLTIKKLCGGINMNLSEFFEASYFIELEEDE